MKGGYRSVGYSLYEGSRCGPSGSLRANRPNVCIAGGKLGFRFRGLRFTVWGFEGLGFQLP